MKLSDVAFSRGRKIYYGKQTKKIRMRILHGTKELEETYKVVVHVPVQVALGAEAPQQLVDLLSIGLVVEFGGLMCIHCSGLGFNSIKFEFLD